MSNKQSRERPAITCFLAASFATLYAIFLNLNISMHVVFVVGLDFLQFRCALVGARNEQLAKLNDTCSQVVVTEDSDKLVWKLKVSGSFSVKSFYNALQHHAAVPYKFMWKIKIPLRVY